MPPATIVFRPLVDEADITVVGASFCVSQETIFEFSSCAEYT